MESRQNDRKRIQGPEISVTPLSIKPPKPLLDDKRQRNDGRGLDQDRDPLIIADVVTNANGSAYLECGNTKIICAVYGFKPNPKAEQFQDKGCIKVEFKFAPFSCEHRKSPQQDDEQDFLAKIITQALKPALLVDSTPKVLIDIYITILENDGCCLAHSITCASVALVDAAIPMKDLVVGSSVSFIENELCLDATWEEQKKKSGELVLGWMPSEQNVSLIRFNGTVENAIVVDAIQRAMDQGDWIYNNSVKNCLKQIKE